MSLAAASRLCKVVCLLIAGLPGDTVAVEKGNAARPAGDAFLVTYGPGEIYWQRFGHNAIWLREPAQKLNHTFNFGFFDFEQESFLRRFVQGRMLYFSAAIPAEREMAYYKRDGRSIRVQKLNLSAQQYGRLRDHLLTQVRPENREYLYDYYLDNCSTRLRDALDLALDGALEERFAAQPGLLTFRGHTRRATAEDYWYYLGLEMVLGIPVDRRVSRWDEMFLPSMLADSLTEVTMLMPDGLHSLVASDSLVFDSGLAMPGLTPPTVWPRYLLPSLGLVLALLLAHQFLPGVLAEAIVRAWLLIAGTLGLFMIAVWLWTDHHFSNPNLNLLLFNPLMSLGLVATLRRPVAFAILIFAAAALITAISADLQYTRDVAALLLPLNLFSAWLLWQQEDSPARSRAS